MYLVFKYTPADHHTIVECNLLIGLQIRLYFSQLAKATPSNSHKHSFLVNSYCVYTIHSLQLVLDRLYSHFRQNHTNL
jgi:hypothetical protein